MTTLTRAYRARKLAAEAFALYEAFRPARKQVRMEGSAFPQPMFCSADTLIQSSPPGVVSFLVVHGVERFFAGRVRDEHSLARPSIKIYGGRHERASPPRWSGCAAWG
jgi:hypothetical protein